MAENRGKKFEAIIRDSFNAVPNTNVVRLHDQTNGFKGSTNPCDFIVYKYPYQYMIECKSVHGNTLPFSNITDNQRRGMLEASEVYGIVAGVICWWVDKDITKFIPIQLIQKMKDKGGKSIRYDILCSSGYSTIEIPGRKKRVFFDYDMEKFFEAISSI